MSDQLKVMPETIISFGVPIDSAKRKEIAIDYWQNFLAWFNTTYPPMQKTNTINAYRSFLALITSISLMVKTGGTGCQPRQKG